MFEIRHYTDENGHDEFDAWRDKLKDRRARIAIDRRIYRVELGNFGDHKPCREGVWELRIDFGPGYRVYYALAGNTLVLLLCGGTKGSQDADISKACEFWKGWQLAQAKKENPQ